MGFGMKSAERWVRVGVLACCLLLFGTACALAQAGTKPEEHKLINPNTASVEMLAKLPGMNEKVARGIVVQREQLGDFQSLDELLEVQGMSKELLEKIKPFISLDPLKTDCSC